MECTFLLTRQRFDAFLTQPFFTKFTWQHQPNDNSVEVNVQVDDPADIMQLVYACMHAGIAVGNEFSRKAVHDVLHKNTNTLSWHLLGGSSV